jgi:hypothetical protein
MSATPKIVDWTEKPTAYWYCALKAEIFPRPRFGRLWLKLPLHMSSPIVTTIEEN